MNTIDPDLPDALQQEIAGENDDRQKRLDTLSMLIARKREEAIAGREACGIEQIWEEDEDAYEGYDDANRQESRVVKPTTSAGPLTRQTARSQTRSTMFLNITRPYVDAAAARVGDMLLPTDDRPFEIKAEPIPELTAAEDDQTPAVDPASGQPIVKTTQTPDGAMQAPATNSDVAADVMAKASKSAEAAQKRIDDWLTECGYAGEKRKAIHDCAKLGVCVLKGPVPAKRVSKAMTKTADGMALEILREIKPVSKRVDPWNLYPDPACGENIHNGNFIFEKDYLTDKQLRELKGVPGYIDEQIEACIEEGPQKQNLDSRQQQNTDRKSLYQIWYYHGSISTDDMEAAGVSQDRLKSTDDVHYAMLTMVNDRVVKAALNVLDSGEFPYDVMPWQVRSSTWAGIGVGRQMRPAQGMIVAASRNMMDNAALTGGPILGINRKLMEPADGNWTLSPRKIFYTTDDGEGVDIRTAIATFDIPSKQVELMNIIEFANKMAEQCTGLPMLLQGQTGNAPDTLGGQLLATNNASTVLRRIARLDDDYITIPHIGRYYEYLLLYGPNEDEKGQFTVEARGSSALVERDIQNHAIVAMLPLSKDPAYELDPAKCAEEALRAQKIDPARLKMSPEKLAAQQDAMKNQAVPAVEVAKIRAATDVHTTEMRTQSATQIAASRDQLTTHKIDVDTDRDTEFNRSLAQRDTNAHMARMQELALTRELAMLKYAGDQKITLEQVKAQLAQTAMKLDTQKDLFVASTAVDVHKHRNPTAPQVATPAIEPAGRAPDGEAYQK